MKWQSRRDYERNIYIDFFYQKTWKKTYSINPFIFPKMNSYARFVCWKKKIELKENDWKLKFPPFFSYVLLFPNTQFVKWYILKSIAFYYCRKYCVFKYLF